MELNMLIVDRCQKFMAKNYPAKPMIIIGNEELKKIGSNLVYDMSDEKYSQLKEFGFISSMYGYKVEEGDFDYGFEIIECR